MSSFKTKLKYLEDISTQHILGRDTAGTGQVEVLTASQVKAMLAVLGASDFTDGNGTTFSGAGPYEYDLGGDLTQVQTLFLPDGGGARTVRWGDADGSTFNSLTRHDTLTTQGKFHIAVAGSLGFSRYEGTTFTTSKFFDDVGALDMDSNPGSTFTGIKHAWSESRSDYIRQVWNTTDVDNGYTKINQTGSLIELEAQSTDPYTGKIRVASNNIQLSVQDVSGPNVYSFGTTSWSALTTSFAGIFASNDQLHLYSGFSNTLVLDGSGDNKLTDGTTNKYGLLLAGFGESDVTGTGANYATLVGTSLTPKKYVDDSIAAAALTNGSGTTANGTAVDLGGALNADASITGVGGTLGVNYGLNNGSDYLKNFNIYATQGSEFYDAAFGGVFLGTIVTKNPAGYTVLNNAGGYNVTVTADPNGAINKTVAGTTTSEVIASSTIARMRFDANGVGSQWTQSELATTFVDNTVAKKGIEYAADYSATFVARSLVDKGYVDNVAAAIDLNSLTDVTTGLPGTPTEADDGKMLFYDYDTGQWITDDAVTHGTSVINCKKSTAGTIAKGLPVYLVGFDADLHTVELADATSGATMPVIGFTAEALDNTNSKHVTTFGKLTGIDTTSTVSTLNPNGETWAVNDALYISTTAGGLTKVRPTGGTTQIQRIAKVLKVDATGGQIFVFNTARTAGLPNLGTDKLWIGDANGIPQEVDKSTIGASIYTQDDSLTGNRLVNLDSNSLTITGGTTNNATPINFEFGSYWQGFTRWGDEGDLQIKSNNNKNPLKVFKKTDAINPTLQVNAGGGGLLTELWSYQDIGGSTTKIDIDNVSIKNYFGGGEYHRIQLGGSGTGVYFWRTGFGHTLGGFVVGNTTTVGSEKISLQGSTLVNDKFEIQTTTAGFLMPRLTTAQMNAIAAPDTHLLIFNTDLNGIYRYNGSAWVALSTGYGIIQLTQNSNNGIPVFYTDIQSALNDANTLGGDITITLHDNITTTAAISTNSTANIDNITFDLNGFTITNTANDSSAVIYNRLQSNVIRIINGSIIKTTGTGHALHFVTGIGDLYMSNCYVYSEAGSALRIESSITPVNIWDLGGCTFKTNTGYGVFLADVPGGVSLTNFISISTGSGMACFLNGGGDVTNFKAIAEGTGTALRVRSAVTSAMNFYAESNSGNCVLLESLLPIVKDFTAISVSGYAVFSSASAYKIENFYAKTTSGTRAVNAPTNSILINGDVYSDSTPCIFISDAERVENVNFTTNSGTYAVHSRFTTNWINCTFRNKDGIGFYNYSASNSKLKGCKFISEKTTGGTAHAANINDASSVVTFINCDFEVADSTANCIKGDAVMNMKVANCSFDGATTAINANVTLSLPGTADAYGNILIG